MLGISVFFFSSISLCELSVTDTAAHTGWRTCRLVKVVLGDQAVIDPRATRTTGPKHTAIIVDYTSRLLSDSI